jgi:hypothetical protein
MCDKHSFSIEDIKDLCVKSYIKGGVYYDYSSKETQPFNSWVDEEIKILVKKNKPKKKFFKWFIW